MFLAAYVYPVASPFVPVVFIIFSGLELQFNNIFFRSSNELPALTLYPISWRELVMAKNIATLLLVVIVFIIGSMTLLYFYPGSVTRGDCRDMFLYLTTVLFPLLHFGNLRSIEFPRRDNGFRVDDLIELIWMLVIVCFVSIPYIIMKNTENGWILLLFYAIGTCLYWYKVSVRKTAKMIEENAITICSDQ
jgi:hypothetical protein